MGLKGVVFRIGSPTVDWITVALRTITPNHRDLRQITIHAHFALDLTTVALPANVANFNEAKLHIVGQWLELDRLLVQLCESHSIRLRVLYYAPPTEKKREMNEYMGHLLPEVMGRGIVDMIDRTG